MKNLLRSLGRWIFKYRKGLAYGILGLFVGQIVFFGLGGFGGESTVFAADTATQSVDFQQKVNGWYESVSAIKKVIDIIIYPLLVVAGVLVDNTLVYGEVFSFDVVLWNLWNIVKNLANLTLGCLVVYYIFKNLISSSNNTKSVKDIILRGLIAGVGIQASWFAMAVLIDVSSILTYGIGGLPVTVLGLKDMELKYNPYMLKDVEVQDANDLRESEHKYKSNVTSENEEMGLFYISECETFNVDDEMVILSPKMIYYISKSKQIKETESNSCFLGNHVYYFSSLYPGLEQYFGGCGDPDNCRDMQISYEAAMDQSKKEINGKGKDYAAGLVTSAVLMQKGNAHEKDGVYGTLSAALYPDEYGVDIDNKQTGETWGLLKLQDIMEGKSYIGIFAALYHSLMNRSSFVPPDIGAYGAFLSAGLSLLHTLAIGIPLVAAALVFMMRIGIIWVAIILAPFIVLFKAFDLEDKVFGGNGNGLLSYLALKNLIPIIFSPAVICFAISLSTVLVTIISNQNMKTKTVATEILGGLISVDLGGVGIHLGELVTSVIGIAITWFLVWAAIETTKLGKGGFIGSLKGLATSALGSMPIIPVPGKGGKGVDFMGVSTVFGSNGSGGILSKMASNLESKSNKQSEEIINQWFKEDGDNGKTGNSNKTTVVAGANFDAYRNHLSSDPKVFSSGGDWTDYEFDLGNNVKCKFGNLNSAEQEQIIGKINNLAEADAKKFGSKTPKVEIGSGTGKKVYVFNNSTSKYEQ